MISCGCRGLGRHRPGGYWLSEDGAPDLRYLVQDGSGDEAGPVFFELVPEDFAGM